MRVVPYHSDYAEVWNDFVEHSKNGTFLLKRHFMDYHAHRFIDCSLLVYKDKELIALFPANFVKEEHTVYSHQGLTYGGLIMGRDITATDVLVTLKEICLWYTQHMHVSTLFYKPIPYIRNILLRRIYMLCFVWVRYCTQEQHHLWLSWIILFRCALYGCEG